MHTVASVYVWFKAWIPNSELWCPFKGDPDVWWWCRHGKLPRGDLNAFSLSTNFPSPCVPLKGVHLGWILKTQKTHFEKIEIFLHFTQAPLFLAPWYIGRKCIFYRYRSYVEREEVDRAIYFISGSRMLVGQRTGSVCVDQTDIWLVPSQPINNKVGSKLLARNKKRTIIIQCICIRVSWLYLQCF